MISWPDEFCVQLAMQGFWVIRFDNRDIGRSTRLDQAGVPNVLAVMMSIGMGAPPAVPYLLKDMAKDSVGLLVPVEGGKDTAVHIPNAKLMIIEGMGHSLPLEVWPQIIETIANHAKQIDD